MSQGSESRQHAPSPDYSLTEAHVEVCGCDEAVALREALDGYAATILELGAEVERLEALAECKPVTGADWVRLYDERNTAVADRIAAEARLARSLASEHAALDRCTAAESILGRATHWQNFARSWDEFVKQIADHFAQHHAQHITGGVLTPADWRAAQPLTDALSPTGP